MEKKQSRGAASLVPELITIAVITLMCGAAEAVGEKEIIFPEIAAICTGAVLAPRFTWRTSKARIFVLIMAGAVIGMGIVRFVPGPTWAQMILAFAIAQLMLAYSGTSFAPVVSGVVLPVMLGTRVSAFLVSAALCTGSILAAAVLLQRSGMREREHFLPGPLPKSPSDFGVLALRTAGAGAVIALGFALGIRFIAAPPILVAYTEFTNPRSGARRRPLRAILLVSLCALAGAACRYGLTLQAGLPLWVSALIGSVLAILLIERMGMFLPPAAAIMVLAMLIPQEAVLLYPLQALAGTAAFMGLACVLFPDRKRAAVE